MKFQSILISSSKILNKEDLNEFLGQNFLLPEKINDLNSIEILPLKNSIGIGQLKGVSEWINLKSNQTKFVIINNSETLTQEAQNSLLKNLEEPPEQTLIILITKNRERILGTIISRCVELFYKNKEVTTSEFKGIAEKLIKTNYIERLKILDNISKEYSNREDIAEIVSEVLKALPKESITKEKLETLKNIYIGVKSSVNLKLCLDLLAIYI